MASAVEPNTTIDFDIDTLAAQVAELTRGLDELERRHGEVIAKLKHDITALRTAHKQAAAATVRASLNLQDASERVLRGLS